mgnify:CR=1 FL=1
MPEQPAPLSQSPKDLISIFKKPTVLAAVGVLLIAIVAAGVYILSHKTNRNTVQTNNTSQTATATKSAVQTSKQATTTTVDISSLGIYQRMLSSDSQNYQNASAAGASFSVTSDNKSFWLYWKPQNWSNSSPKKLIISLGGHDGYASQDFAAWYPILSEKYDFALTSLQWWFGQGETSSDYYTPAEMNKVINSFLASQGFTQTDLIVFEGYSRGSANSYSIAALNSSSKYFDYVISNAGRFANDYSPNKDILNGTFGTTPFANYKWILYCGEKDPEPDINGCQAMESTKTTIEKYGASVVLFIKDPKGLHGSFMTTPTNAKQALDLILK